jgi:hypothetical protein
MNCRFSRFRSSDEKTSPLRLNFELLHECRKPCGNRGCGGVVLAFQGSPNCRERHASIASGIHPALARTGNDPLTNPVVDPISRGGRMAHEAGSNVFISRSSTRVPSVVFRTERAPRKPRGAAHAGDERGVWKVPLASRYPSRALKETPNRATAAGPANARIPTKKAVTRLMRASLVRSLFNKRYTVVP